MLPARQARLESLRALVILSQVALGLGCAGTHAAEPAAASGSPVARPVSSEGPRQTLARGLPDVEWGWLQVGKFSLELPVPERAAWRVDGASERWFSARHAGSGDQLEVRAWSARRTVSLRECEAELYLGRPELRRGAEGALLEERRLGEPAGFDVWLRAWAEAAGVGTALVVGAGPGRCFAALFHARGDEAEVGSALRLAVDGIFENVRLRSVDDTRGPRPVPAF